MYFFSFGPKEKSTRLIMGTSAGGGMVCNNMTVETTSEGKTTIARSIQTINSETKVSASANTDCAGLARFSGFYPISPNAADSVIKKGAFIAVQGSYISRHNGKGPLYKVEIGLSTDGKKSTTYTFTTDMQFADSTNTLTIPSLENPSETLLSVCFTPGYSAIDSSSFGSLVKIKGSISGCEFEGSTLLNPVPLSAFKGASMKGQNHEELTVINDKHVVYHPPEQDKKIEMKEILYVPVMYIMAYKVDPADINCASACGINYVMSYGTDGKKGLACIITEVSNQKITAVTSLQ